MLQSPEQLCRRLVSWGFLGVSVCFFVLHVFFQCLLVCSCCQIFIGQIGKIKFSCCKILATTPHVNQPLQSRSQTLLYWPTAERSELEYWENIFHSDFFLSRFSPSMLLSIGFKALFNKCNSIQLIREPWYKHLKSAKLPKHHNKTLFWVWLSFCLFVFCPDITLIKCLKPQKSLFVSKSGGHLVTQKGWV